MGARDLSRAPTGMFFCFLTVFLLLLLTILISQVYYTTSTCQPRQRVKTAPPQYKKRPKRRFIHSFGPRYTLYGCYVITTAPRLVERGLETRLKPLGKFFFFFLSFFLITNMNFLLNRLRKPIQPPPTPTTPPRRVNCVDASIRHPLHKKMPKRRFIPPFGP